MGHPQFLSVEAIVENCTGAAIGRLAFIEEFSLLVVTDAHGRFTLVTSTYMHPHVHLSVPHGF